MYVLAPGETVDDAREDLLRNLFKTACGESCDRKETRCASPLDSGNCLVDQECMEQYRVVSEDQMDSTRVY